MSHQDHEWRVKTSKSWAISGLATLQLTLSHESPVRSSRCHISLYRNRHNTKRLIALTIMLLSNHQRDLNQIVLDQMEQFQEELSAQMALLQAKHTARLKKRTNAQILKAFEHMVPQGFADSSVRESPF